MIIKISSSRDKWTCPTNTFHHSGGRKCTKYFTVSTNPFTYFQYFRKQKTFLFPMRLKNCYFLLIFCAIASCAKSSNTYEKITGSWYQVRETLHTKEWVTSGSGYYEYLEFYFEPSVFFGYSDSGNGNPPFDYAI